MNRTVLYSPTATTPKPTLEQLALIKGAMWTARYPMPWGPRPNQPDNILAPSAVMCYRDSSERRAMLRFYRSKHYTHADIGAWVPGGFSPYHGFYPWVNLSFDQYLDILQEMWDERIYPVVFIKPDNWSAAQLETLTPYYSQPRAQDLVRIAVPGGWEPSKDTPNAEWVRWCEWGSRVLPKTLRLIHLEADFDAPGNNDDFTPGTSAYIGFPEAWARVAPYLHGYLVQNYGYMAAGSEVPTIEFLQNFTAQFQGRGSLIDRFQNGYAGWPTSSAWGDGKRMRVYAAEFAATADFHWNWAERYAQQIGDAAMAAGADGYLDGGTV